MDVWCRIDSDDEAGKKDWIGVSSERTLVSYRRPHMASLVHWQVAVSSYMISFHLSI